jgi:hypothetical protein
MDNSACCPAIEPSKKHGLNNGLKALPCFWHVALTDHTSRRQSPFFSPGALGRIPGHHYFSNASLDGLSKTSDKPPNKQRDCLK